MPELSPWFELAIATPKPIHVEVPATVHYVDSIGGWAPGKLAMQLNKSGHASCACADRKHAGMPSYGVC